MFEIVFTNQAIKDFNYLKKYKVLFENAKNLLSLIEKNPFINPPPYEKLYGFKENVCSRRINREHRLVYQVLKKEKIIKILRMATHYNNI